MSDTQSRHHVTPMPDPVVDAAVFALAPGFRALSILAIGAPLADRSPADRAVADAVAVARAGEPAWATAHLEAWADVFRRFGAKPQRTPCSADALRRRAIKDGALPRIHPVVDLYNAISVAFGIPVGGENAARYVGAPRLTVADGTEPFDTIRDGQPAQERPEPGEVIWRDDVGVTCRRWNWRQGVRTRLDADARLMWFILESLPPLPPEALQAAGDALTAGLRAMMPGTEVSRTLIQG